MPNRENSGPDWVREALLQARVEALAFVRTAVAFTLRPSQFAAEWASGQRRAQNPLDRRVSARGRHIG